MTDDRLDCWYLAFFEPGHFIGACYVYAEDLDMAIAAAWIHNCHPGGDVVGCEIPKGGEPHKKWIGKLLNLEDLRKIDKEAGGDGELKFLAVQYPGATPIKGVKWS